MLLRSATTNADAAERMKDIVAAQLLSAVGKFIADDAPRRAGLIATQVLGMALCCFVLRLPPVVAMSSEQLVEWLGPTLQRYALGQPSATRQFNFLSRDGSERRRSRCAIAIRVAEHGMGLVAADLPQRLVCTGAE